LIITAGLETWIGIEQRVEGDEPAHFIRVNPTGIWGNRIRRA
jgi:hypothetical protein